MTHSNDMLNVMFQDAQHQATQVDDAFAARILADAYGIQDDLAPLTRTPAPAPKSTARRFVRALLSGGLLAVGMGSAAMAGLVIGYVQPESFSPVTEIYGITAAEPVLELLPGADVLLASE